MIYTQDAVAAKLQEFYHLHHRPPGKKDLSPPPEGYPWYRTICQIFGSFTQALQYAFPNYQQLKARSARRQQRAHTREMRHLLKEEYWQKFLELGYAPTIDQVDADPDMHSQSSYQRYWGGIKPLLQELGLAESYHRPRSDGHEYTEDYLLRLLHEKYLRDGKVPTYDAVTADWRLPGGQVYTSRFRCSWAEILRRAHIPPVFSHQAHQGLSDEYLLEALRRKARLLGHPPSARQVTKDASMPNARTYADHFGSYYQALLRAGLTPAPAQEHSHRAALTRQAQAASDF